MEFALLAILLVCGVVYLLPAIIAFRRRHPNRFLIAALNTMTGLTGLGWYFALRAALSVPAVPAAQPDRVLVTAPSTPSINSEHEPAKPPTIASQSAIQTERKPKMGFFKSIGTCFGKYAVFSGRASRSEFWWFGLFCFLLLLVTSPMPAAAGIILLGLLLPLLAVGIRRLHDINKSGWFCLLFPIPILGLILFAVWNCRAGDLGNNRFGTNPLTPI